MDDIYLSIYLKSLKTTFMKTILSNSAAVAALAVYTALNASAAKPSKPNIVLIMADDIGAECFGSYGGISYSTPVLDNLANQGVRFAHCYSQPLCTPSRVKIMTGKYNFRNYEAFGYLNPNQKTFGNLMKEAGYATCIAGKWQLNGNVTQKDLKPGWEDSSRPYHFGFDEYCLWQLHRPKDEGERYANPLIFQNGKKLEGLENSYGPDVFSNFVTDFIDRKSGKPFFVYYPMVLVHDPFVPTPDSPAWKDKSKRYENDTVYFRDMVKYMDKIVGRVVNKLKEKGVWENTIFIFTGDNGTNVKITSKTTDRYKLVRGAKGSSLNTGNHVPLIIIWSGKGVKSVVYNGIVDFADFLPTICEAAGISLKDFQTDGQSFLSVVKGSQEPIQQEIFIHYSPHWGNFISNRWVMNREYKLYRNGEFFKNDDDLLEKHPLLILSPEQQKIKEKFEVILSEKEKIVPFETIK
jgi:arylsulfatase A